MYVKYGNNTNTSNLKQAETGKDPLLTEVKSGGGGEVHSMEWRVQRSSVTFLRLASIKCWELTTDCKLLGSK